MQENRSQISSSFGISGKVSSVSHFDMACRETPSRSLTALTNERDFDRDDNIPRIAWGKYIPDGAGRETLGMSVEVNHRFLDGIHLGRFYQTLQASIDALEP